MNLSLMTLELWVVALGLALLLVDLWAPARMKRPLGYVAAACLGLLLWWSFSIKGAGSLTAGVLAGDPAAASDAFARSFLADGLALFFKRLFLVAGILVLVMAAEYADRLQAGVVEYYSLTVFALAGMMLAASANNLAMLFVSVELITVTFYVLASFERRLPSLEAGVKYLILGAMTSAFMVYGIALVYGVGGSMAFVDLAAKSSSLVSQPWFLLGMLMIMAGLGFKIAVVPFQLWVPDVYQGAPTPTTAFLAVGSKAAGFVLTLRLLQSVCPEMVRHGTGLLMVLAGATILYGNLCAIPQTNLKRLLGYSSIAHAGYLLMGLAVMTQAGSAAILYYLAGYLFSVLAAFAVIAVVVRCTGADDLAAVAGLGRRSPFLAAALTLAMVSLAGVPPMAGFFGKFLLIKAVLEQGPANPAFFWLAGVAIVGVVISLYYYFGVIRAMYWTSPEVDAPPVAAGWGITGALCVCIAGMLYLGLQPAWLLAVAAQAVKALRLG